MIENEQNRILRSVVEKKIFNPIGGVTVSLLGSDQTTPTPQRLRTPLRSIMNHLVKTIA